MSALERIIATGNRTFDIERLRNEAPRSSKIRCADGFEMSVIAGEGTYCSPRPSRYGAGDAPPSFPGPYSGVEVGFPTQRPEPWDQWKTYAETPDDPTETVYGYVPVDLVRALVASHGGEA